MNVITIILFVLIILQELQIIRLNKQVFALANLLGQQVIKMIIDQDAFDKMKDKDTGD